MSSQVSFSEPYKRIYGYILTLKLDLVLDDESLTLVVDLLGELGRDGVVSSRALDNKTLVALDALELVGLLDGPLANVGPFLFALLVGAGSILLGGGNLPSLLPVVGELLEKITLDGGGLEYIVSGQWLLRGKVRGERRRGDRRPERAGTRLTVNVGSSGAEGDSTSSARATPASRTAEAAVATVLNFILRCE